MAQRRWTKDCGGCLLICLYAIEDHEQIPDHSIAKTINCSIQRLGFCGKV
jgi:hypothetical protein